MHLSKLGFAALLPLSLLVLPAPSAQAQITKTGGPVTTILDTLTAPTSVVAGAHQSSTDFFLLNEQQNVHIGTGLLNSLVTNTGTISNTDVASYLIYTDKPAGLPASQTYNITVTSTHKILGIINGSALLTLSDSKVGLSNVLYPNTLGNGSLTRGQELGDTFSVVGNTVTIKNVTFGEVDELRIITAAVPEVSTLFGFGSLLALGGLAASRQRKQARLAA